MRKNIKISLILASFLILLLIGGGTLLLLFKPTTFSIKKEADFYLVTQTGISSYKLGSDGLILIHHDKMSVSQKTFNVKMAELDERYLLFAENGDKGSGKSRLVRLDFEKGKLEKFPLDHPATTASGSSTTSLLTLDVDTLTSFDSDGDPRHQVKLSQDISGHFLPSLSGHEGRIFLTGMQADLTQLDQLSYQLFQLEEQSFELQEEIAIPFLNGLIPVFMDQEQVGDKLYWPVLVYKDPSTGLDQTSQDLLTYDLLEKSFDHISISTGTPQKFLKLENSPYLLILHDNYSWGRVLLTLYHTETGEEQVLDLTELAQLEDSSTSVWAAKLIDQKLILALNQKLLVYDIQAQTLLDQEILKDFPIHLW